MPPRHLPPPPAFLAVAAALLMQLLRRALTASPRRPLRSASARLEHLAAPLTSIVASWYCADAYSAVRLCASCLRSSKCSRNVSPFLASGTFGPFLLAESPAAARVASAQLTYSPDDPRDAAVLKCSKSRGQQRQTACAADTASSSIRSPLCAQGAGSDDGIEPFEAGHMLQIARDHTTGCAPAPLLLHHAPT